MAEKIKKHRLSEFTPYNIGWGPWDSSFRHRIKSTPQYKTLFQYTDNPKISIKDTEYYKWLNRTMSKHGSVWNGVITTKEQVEERTIKLVILSKNNRIV